MQNKLDAIIRNWFSSLKEKYHLNLTNKDSFAEIYSTQVTKGKFLLSVVGALLLVFIAAFCVISFTPIKRIVPGFESDEMHQELLTMKKKMMIMEFEIAGKLDYATHLDSIFDMLDEGNELALAIKIDTVISSEKESDIPVFTSEKQATSLYKYHFYKPITGIVSQKFNVKDKHFGIDIVSKKNETIKAALSGKIIVAGWTLDEGNVIGIQHQDNLISFYKHNSVLLKRKGDVVKSGQVIAIVGNSGELTTGPHLHFEIWQNGTPLDPSDVISFD
ncbi:MAG: murein DD-endopeptidase MepM/ murein hydrolase activator NlpD [Glaciecola sp.]|jgi:murein DD-endopeptidase MepM/ murein hydrolase activator NlpD